MQAHARRGHRVILGSIGLKGQAEKHIEEAARHAGVDVRRIALSVGWSLANVVTLRDVVRESSVDVVHCHGYKANILMASMPRRWFRRPILTTLHGWTATRNLSKIAMYELADAIALRRCDHVVTVSAAQRSHRWVSGLPARKCSVIHNAIDPEDAAGVNSV